MDFKVYLSLHKDVEKELSKKLEINKVYSAKCSTIKNIVEYDKKNESDIKSLKMIKVAVPFDSGTLLLFCNLGCRYKAPYGGELYIQKFTILNKTPYSKVNGVKINLEFITTDTNTTKMKKKLRTLYNHKDFIYSLKQFDDFMRVFNYYQTISNELNNNASYNIRSISNSKKFISVKEKSLFNHLGQLKSEYSSLISVYNSDSIILGYYIPEYTYDSFNNLLQTKVLNVLEITIDYSNNIIRQIKQLKDNIYLSSGPKLNINNRSLRSENFINVVKKKDKIVLTIEESNIGKKNFLNLYNMGQQIKVDSIDDSLKLIKQGSTSEASDLIEYLIGDKEMPNIEKKLNANTKTYTKGLDDSQIEAFNKAVDSSPVTLIKGPPGTGKTHVINAITQYITKELGEKVVISSQTHVAIDNVLDELMKNSDIIIPQRITNKKNKYSEEDLDKTLYDTWGVNFRNHTKNSKNIELSKKILSDLDSFKGDKVIAYSKNLKSKSDYTVIGATTTTSAIRGKKGLDLFKDYKWLIIDEVSKCPITEVLRYLAYIDKIILVGDDYQLAPLLEFREEDVKRLECYDVRKYNELVRVYEESIFSKTIDKARKSNRLVELNNNYRSLPSVLDAYNIFYNDSLISKRLDTSPSIVEFSKDSIYNSNDTFFVNVLDGLEQRDGHSKYNVSETNATAVVLEEMINSVKCPSTVSVSAIFPYAAQISLFTKDKKELINLAKKTFFSFEIDTVDSFQGRESDIVLVNTVVTTNNRNFLSDFRRINVSLSRAKDKLIIFGNKDTLSNIKMKVSGGLEKIYFKDIIDNIKSNSSRTKYIEYTNQGGLHIEPERKF